MKKERTFSAELSKWLFAVNGLIIFKRDKRKYLKILLFVAIHGFYYYCCSNIDDYLNSNSITFRFGYLKHVFFYGRLLDGMGIIVKILWYFVQLRRIENHGRILNMIYLESIKLYGFRIDQKPSKTFIGLFMLLILGVYWDIKIVTEEKKWYTISWLFPQMKDLAEYYIMELILRKYKGIISTVNKQFEALNRITEFNIIFPSTKPQKLGYLTHLEKSEKVAAIRESSFINLKLVNSLENFGTVFTFPLLVTLCTKLWNIINCTYYMASSVLFSQNNNFEIWRPTMWNVFCVVYSLALIRIWNTVEREENKTCILIHDIWNTYVEKKKAIDVLYLQLISMRLLANKLKLTAFGFFPLNMSVVQSMITRAITITIILVQLKSQII